MTLLGLTLALLLGAPTGAAPSGVRWERSLDGALKSARRAQRPVMVDFWAEWCGWCRRLDQTTYRDPTVVRMLSEFVTVKVNTEGTAREVEFAARYNVSSLPTVAFFSPEGHLLLRVDGYQGPGSFPQTLEQARSLAARVAAWESALRRDPDDAQALLALGLYLFEREFYEDSHEFLSRAVRVDKNRPTPVRKQARLLVAVMDFYDRRYGETEALLKDALALKPADPLDGKLLFHLARTYDATGRVEQARATLRKLLDGAPTGPLADKARETLLTLERR